MAAAAEGEGEWGWMAEVAGEELEKLEAAHPGRFGPLKAELKRLIADPAAAAAATPLVSPHSDATVTSSSSQSDSVLRIVSTQGLPLLLGVRRHDRPPSGHDMTMRPFLAAACRVVEPEEEEVRRQRRRRRRAGGEAEEERGGGSGEGQRGDGHRAGGEVPQEDSRLQGQLAWLLRLNQATKKKNFEAKKKLEEKWQMMT